MSYLLRMKENEANFTKTDKKIAAYLAGEPQQAAILSAEEIGSMTGTSATAVIRFIKKMNYRGLNELRVALAQETEPTNEDTTMIIEHGDSVRTIKAKLSKLMSENAKATGLLNDDKTFEESVQLLEQADTVYLFGVGASGIVAEDLYNKLLRINKRCVFDPKSNIQMMYSAHATEKDVYLAFSYRGESRDVNSAVLQCKENGASGIAVSRAIQSALSKLCSIHIKLPGWENDLRIGAIQSRYAELMVSDILFLGLAQKNYDQIEENLKKTRTVVQKSNGLR